MNAGIVNLILTNEAHESGTAEPVPTAAVHPLPRDPALEVQRLHAQPEAIEPAAQRAPLHPHPPRRTHPAYAAANQIVGLAAGRAAEEPGEHREEAGEGEGYGDQIGATRGQGSLPVPAAHHADASE